jgi:hypothetical protein
MRCSLSYIAGMKLGQKLWLAGVSGGLVELVWIALLNADTLIGHVAMYTLCGGLFVAGVLLPYLKRRDLFSWRSAGLVLASSVSFYCAVEVSMEWSSGRWGPNLRDFVVSSLVGAAIVFLTAPYLLRFRFSIRYAIAGVFAAIVGGVVFGTISDVVPYNLVIAFVIWHMLMCVALHITSQLRGDDSWLAGVAKPKFNAVLILLSLLTLAPIVDDGIGALIQHRYAERDAGLTAYESINAHGFLEQRKKPRYFISGGCHVGCLSRVRDGTYAFQEYLVVDDSGQYLLFFMADRTDVNCHSREKDWDIPFDPTWSYSTLVGENRCLTYRLSKEPTARFAIRESDTTVDALWGLYPLRRTVRQVVRTSDSSVATDVVYYKFDSRVHGGEFDTVESWDAFFERALPPSGGEWQPPE